jgi:RimJ/RimL family protein N-acetyltransferase
MKPVTLTSERLVLDQPTLADVDVITEYCQDPLFERYLTTPWPYETTHSVGFVSDYVPSGWADDREFTWAVRAGDQLVGVVGYRTERGDVGFWVGAPHRGNGYMTEAVGAVSDWVFASGAEQIEWFCLVGNYASAAVARKNGFAYIGDRHTPHAHRGGIDALAWFGVLRASDSRKPKPGWPIGP